MFESRLIYNSRLAWWWFLSISSAEDVDRLCKPISTTSPIDHTFSSFYAIRPYTTYLSLNSPRIVHAGNGCNQTFAFVVCITTLITLMSRMKLQNYLLQMILLCSWLCVSRMVWATRTVRDAVMIGCYCERNGKGFSKIACGQGENNLKFLHKIQSLLSSAVSIVLFNLKEKCLVIKSLRTNRIVRRAITHLTCFQRVHGSNICVTTAYWLVVLRPTRQSQHREDGWSGYIFQLLLKAPSWNFSSGYWISGLRVFAVFSVFLVYFPYRILK
jgi:hypothetical protein